MDTHSVCPAGHLKLMCMCARWPYQGRIRRSQDRSPVTSWHSCFLIAALTRMRSTSGNPAASRNSVVTPGVHRAGSTARWSPRTTLVTSMDSRSAALSATLGRGSSPISASNPTWCAAWPPCMGPPRGLEMSST